MAELAKIEAAGIFKEIDEVKSWINDTLWYLNDACSFSGDNTLQTWQYEVKRELFEDQCTQIIMFSEDIANIYAKHKVTELFKPISEDIENYLQLKMDELSAFALCVDVPDEEEYSLQCGPHVQPAVAAISPPAVAAISPPAVAAISLPAVAVSSPPGEQVSTQLGSVKTGKAQHSPSSHKFKRSKFNFKSKSKFGYNFKKQVQNFIPHCRFCVVDGHSSVNCTIYGTYQQRFDRCEELKLCVQCTNPNHAAGPLCPGSKTGSGGLYKICKYCNKL